jgi:hypothetical protein
MVDMALKEMTEKNVMQLDDKRKASMVSNLWVVLCSESGVHPEVNTGTLDNRTGSMASRKAFLLRMDSALWVDLEVWAQDELRSVNGQIEYLLKPAVLKRKGKSIPAGCARDQSANFARQLRPFDKTLIQWSIWSRWTW